ncbi:MAG: EutN/CcmL family microcompartment protein [Stellaceae bacterium]
MRTGKVVGSIVAAKRLWETPSGALLVVELDPPQAKGQKPQQAQGQKPRRKENELPRKEDEPPREQLIAFDTLGCGEGEPVLVATGSAATAWFAGKPPPVDALIIASLA